MGESSTFRVGISGSYGGFNLGDEAILQMIIAELRQAHSVEITVFTRDAQDTRDRHAVDAVQFGSLSRRDAKELLSSLDLFILGGGGILYDGDADMFLREVFIAHEVGTPVMTWAIGAGPLAVPAIRDRVRDALSRAATLSVRDRNSQRLLEEVGIEREIVVTADPALLLTPDPLTLDEILRAEAIDPKARLVGFSVREPGPAAPELDVEHYHALLANAADFMVDRLEAEVVFIPLERRTYDVQHSHGVVGKMCHAQRATVLKREYAPGQIVSLLQHFQFAVGMRLHFVVFSVLAGVPVVALPYADKVSAFVNELGLVSVPLQNTSAGKLLAELDRAWDERERPRDGLGALDALKRRARRSGELAAELLDRSRRDRRRRDPPLPPPSARAP
jgi:polysaccharide pyruvyl transferase CsaB